MSERITIKDIRSKNGPEVSVRMQKFANPQEYQQMLMDLAISSEFKMRYRGLLEYYGKDFIAYKKEKPSDENRNEFLRVFSTYMTHYLEDDCPPSWKQCQPSFWEDFIFSFYPDHIKFSPDQKEVEKFLYQLKKFVRWLDKRIETSWHSVVEQYSLEVFSDLKICEQILNSLTLKLFPRIHHRDWDQQEDMRRYLEKGAQYTEEVESTFEVTSIMGDIVIVREQNTYSEYSIKGLPCELMKPGINMYGLIGKKSGDCTWEWYIATSIHPPRGRKLHYPISILHEGLTTNDGVHFTKK